MLFLTQFSAKSLQIWQSIWPSIDPHPVKIWCISVKGVRLKSINILFSTLSQFLSSDLPQILSNCVIIPFLHPTILVNIFRNLQHQLKPGEHHSPPPSLSSIILPQPRSQSFLHQILSEFFSELVSVTFIFMNIFVIFVRFLLGFFFVFCDFLCHFCRKKHGKITYEFQTYGPTYVQNLVVG